MDKPKQMIVMRRDLKMRKGKIAAQAGHALRLCLRRSHVSSVWDRCRQMKTV